MRLKMTAGHTATMHGMSFQPSKASTTTRTGCTFRKT
jgi:hypothetical protein